MWFRYLNLAGGASHCQGYGWSTLNNICGWSQSTGNNYFLRGHGGVVEEIMTKYPRELAPNPY